jgi:hypothetical protein
MFAKFDLIKKLIDCIMDIHDNKRHMCRNITDLAKMTVFVGTDVINREHHSSVLKSTIDDWFLVACHTYLDRSSEGTMHIQKTNLGDILLTMHSLETCLERKIINFDNNPECAEIEIIVNGTDDELFQRMVVDNEIELFASYIEYCYHNTMNNDYYFALNATRLLSFSTEAVQAMIDIFEAEAAC